MNQQKERITTPRQRPRSRCSVRCSADGTTFIRGALRVEAYRRDRRKDALLQESGYLVLRFLAEDVGKRLDEVLDTILRALSYQHRHRPSSST
jgi:hypothetical protein